jgi:hypothetical protein
MRQFNQRQFIVVDSQIGADCKGAISDKLLFN